MAPGSHLLSRGCLFLCLGPSILDQLRPVVSTRSCCIETPPCTALRTLLGLSSAQRDQMKFHLLAALAVLLGTSGAAGAGGAAANQTKFMFCNATNPSEGCRPCSPGGTHGRGDLCAQAGTPGALPILPPEDSLAGPNLARCCQSASRHSGAARRTPMRRGPGCSVQPCGSHRL